MTILVITLIAIIWLISALIVLRELAFEDAIGSAFGWGGTSRIAYLLAFLFAPFLLAFWLIQDVFDFLTER